MVPPDLTLEPDEIRAIRERLGLSQVEAGELLGGGPRAFTKYEAGTIGPGPQWLGCYACLNRTGCSAVLDGQSAPTRFRWRGPPPGGDW